MSSVTCNSLKVHTKHSSWAVAAVLVTALLLIVLAFTMSFSHWLLLGVFAVLVMAVAGRFTVSDHTESHQLPESKMIFTDGGTLQRPVDRPDSNKPVESPVVRDGGSFERAQRP